MKRYLFALWDGGGTAPPMFGVARRLIERGHRVHVLGDHTLAREANDARCTFSAWRTAPSRRTRLPADDPTRDWEASNPLALFARVRDVFLCGPAMSYARDLLGELERTPADVVVVDLMLLGAALGAEKSGLPSAALCTSVFPFPQKGIPIIGSGGMPAAGPLGRLRDAAGGWMLQRLFDGGLGVVNQARRELGLGPIAHTLDQMLRHQRVLVLSSAAFEFPGGQPPAHVRYVGALLDDPSWAEPWRSPFADSDARPLVLVALSSTFQDQLPTLRRIVAALASLPVRAVVTLGPGLDDSELAGSDNVAVVRSAPHGQLLTEAAVCLSHCGHGSTLKALAAGVPLVCMPFGRDQGDNAARVVFHGAGVRIHRDDHAEAIARAVRTVLDDQRLRRGARRMAERLAGEAGGDVAADELVALGTGRADATDDAGARVAAQA